MSEHLDPEKLEKDRLIFVSRSRQRLRRLRNLSRAGIAGVVGGVVGFVATVGYTRMTGEDPGALATNAYTASAVALGFGAAAFGYAYFVGKSINKALEQQQPSASNPGSDGIGI